MKNMSSSIADRAAVRRASMIGNKAQNFLDAEIWDLAFWQKQSPQDRLSALVAIHRDIDNIHPEVRKDS